MNTPLHKAVEAGHPEIVRELCRHVRKSGITKKNDEGLTPLLLAVKKGFWIGARILLSYRAKPSARSNRGETMFHLLLNRPEIDKEGQSFLFDAVSSFPKLLLISDDQGQTPLHIIAEQNHHALTFPLRFLPGKRKKKRERYVRAKNYEDLTAIDIADNKNHKKLAKKIRNFPKDSLGDDRKHRSKALKYRPFKPKF
jgi:ankyrin repeat protein